ncbi:ROK family protein [bacterium]|nr:ROK family protein [bacterium]
MENKITLGVDIGGTFVKVATVDGSGEILDMDIFPTPQSPPDVALSIIIDDICEFLEDCETNLEDIAGVGVGFPGAVTIEEGIIEASPNLKSWRGLGVKSIFEDVFGPKIIIDNDANAAAYGEYLWGKHKGADPLVIFTLGTGVGGGIIIDGQIFRGKWGGAGEIGHHVIEMNGRQCTCGNRGCIEAYAGAKGIVTLAWEYLKKDKGSLLWDLMGGDYGSLDPEMIGDTAREGDKTALKVTREVSRALGVATANMINILNPECIIFAGGVTGWGKDILLKTIRNEAHCRALKSLYNSCTIDISEKGQNCGVIGAAAMAFNHIK